MKLSVDILTFLKGLFYTKTEVSEKINEFYTSTIVPVLDTKAGLDAATSDVNGLMSSNDKVKLDSIEVGATNMTFDDLTSHFYTRIEVDNELSSKAEINHTHDDHYYTESEVDEKLGDIETILNEITGV